MVQTKKKSLKVGKRVNTAHVDSAIRNYKKERWVQNSERLGKNDSLSVWYSVEELEDYLATVKDNGADGIRMYFGAYDADYKEQPLFAGRQTVVLVATKHKEENGISSDKDVYVNTDNGTSILAYNAGKLCPPFCGTGGDDGGFGGFGFGTLGMTIIDKGDDGIVLA